MTIVISSGTVLGLQKPGSGMPASARGLSLFDGMTQTYATLYRTQPQVRKVVSFIARNMAQLGLHVYERVDDVDRRRRYDHPLAELIRRPNRWTSRFRFMEGTISDLCIYDLAVWWKVKDGDRRALLRLPPRMLEPIGDQWLYTDVWRLRGNRGYRDIPSNELVVFHGYNPDDERLGAPPLEALRRILAEEIAATDYREELWGKGARLSGVIERPKDAPAWTDKARDNFASGWRQMFTGDGPNVGGTAVLEDGMTYKPISMTARDAQYVEARKLTREEVASAYHIPLPMVGILDHATFSNIREQHANLYQDTFGPWCVSLEEDVELQLLPDMDPEPERFYTEFNIAEKLKGSFETQAAAIQKAVGAPVMTPNEGRARLNLSRDLDPRSDMLVRPLNVENGADDEEDTTTTPALPPGETDDEEDDD